MKICCVCKYILKAMPKEKKKTKKPFCADDDCDDADYNDDTHVP